jgi:hypothetical protein
MNKKEIQKTMKNYEPDFKKYLATNFPEHATRILKSHSKAWFSRVFFPMVFFLVPAAFFVALAFFVYCLKQPDLFAFQKQEKIAELIQNMSLHNTLISISITGGCISLFCFFIGLMIGFSRAHHLLFEGEKLELAAKNLWLMEVLYAPRTEPFGTTTLPPSRGGAPGDAPGSKPEKKVKAKKELENGFHEPEI